MALCSGSCCRALVSTALEGARGWGTPGLCLQQASGQSPPPLPAAGSLSPVRPGKSKWLGSGVMSASLPSRLLWFPWIQRALKVRQLIKSRCSTPRPGAKATHCMLLAVCVCIWCTEKHMAGDSILTDRQIMMPIPFKPQLGTCACRTWGGDNTGTDNHRGNLVDLAGRRFHAGNGAGLQFRTRTFEPLLTWREESCTSKVTALRDSSPESQEVTY